MNAQRSIITALLLVVTVGFVRGRQSNTDAGARRIVGATLGGVILLFIANGAPGFAKGLAWLMAAAVLISDGGEVFGAVTKATTGPSKKLGAT